MARLWCPHRTTAMDKRWGDLTRSVFHDKAQKGTTTRGQVSWPPQASVFSFFPLFFRGRSGGWPPPGPLSWGGGRRLALPTTQIFFFPFFFSQDSALLSFTLHWHPVQRRSSLPTGTKFWLLSMAQTYLTFASFWGPNQKNLKHENLLDNFFSR